MEIKRARDKKKPHIGLKKRGVERHTINDTGCSGGREGCLWRILSCCQYSTADVRLSLCIYFSIEHGLGGCAPSVGTLWLSPQSEIGSFVNVSVGRLMRTLRFIRQVDGSRSAGEKSVTGLSTSWCYASVCAEHCASSNAVTTPAWSLQCPRKGPLIHGLVTSLSRRPHLI